VVLFMQRVSWEEDAPGRVRHEHQERCCSATADARQWQLTSLARVLCWCCLLLLLLIFLLLRQSRAPCAPLVQPCAVWPWPWPWRSSSSSSSSVYTGMRVTVSCGCCVMCALLRV
jgi:hypothetical protein